MDLLILHLSDMHFGSENNYNNFHINAITSALKEAMNGTEHVFIIISGDLTYSGKKLECIQVSKFIFEMKESIKKRYEIADIQVFMVPGNHDMDYKKTKDIGRKELEELEKKGNYGNLVQGELAKLEQFFVLSKFYECFTNPCLLDRKIVTIDDKIVQLNLINTAVFSSLDEDQGFHFITEEDIRRINEQNNSDFVITVMHHPHHWYSSCCKKMFEEALYSRSDIIFVGHEHYESSMKIERDDSSVNIFSAGKLGDRGNWENSEFHVASLNLSTRAYTTRKYVWNEKEKIYEEKGKKECVLSQDRYNNLGLMVKLDYMRKLEEDKHLISGNIRDYFVFPLLVEEDVVEEYRGLPREIDSLDEFMNSLKAGKKVIISGASDSGKSVLASILYEHLSSRMITLFVKGLDVCTDPERVIRYAFEDAYSYEKVKYEAFMQMTSDNLAIIIDDMDAIDPTREDGFTKYIMERFGIIIETCQNEIDIDIKSRLRKKVNSRDFKFYRIAPFYADRRKKLVSNVVRKIGKGDERSQEQIISTLCDVLTKQKYLYSWNPEFIVQFVMYYCNNVGEAMRNDGSVFSKVFESNLTQLIKPFALKMNVDKVMMILDKIAYGIYVDKNYPITSSDIGKIIQDYNEEYGSKIDVVDFINLLVNAKIMKKKDEGYIFYDRNYLAYFTAREIKRRCLEDGDLTQFYHVLEYSYSGLNADILLFVTYITDNINIIRQVMEHAEKASQEWKEFDIRNIDVPFLVKPVEQIVKPFEEKDREKAEEEHVKQEKREMQSINIANDASIFSGETEELSFVQKIMRSISLMIILARTLPSFEHMMKKEDKQKCVDMLYRMPLKIFEAWAKDIDIVSMELISDIKEFLESEYRKEKANSTPLKDEEALIVLRWEAISLFLDLMDAFMNNATKENTYDFIDAFPYKELPTYGIEHLIGLSRRDNVGEFIAEAERIFSEEKQSLAKTMIKRVARNYMVNSKHIKPTEIQRLNSKLFYEKLAQERLLVERNKNKKKQ